MFIVLYDILKINKYIKLFILVNCEKFLNWNLIWYELIYNDKVLNDLLIWIIEYE